MRLLLGPAVAAALFIAPEAALSEGAPDIAGKWDTTYGLLDFTVTDVKDKDGAVVGKAAKAAYKSEGGTVAGELKDSTLVGHWHEPHSSMKCASKRAGTFYWGRVEFAFNPAVDAYEGKWGYCDEAPQRGWSGKRAAAS